MRYGRPLACILLVLTSFLMSWLILKTIGSQMAGLLPSDGSSAVQYVVRIW